MIFLSAETCETELLPPSSIGELPEKLLTSGVYLPGEHPSVVDIGDKLSIFAAPQARSHL